MKIFRIEDQNGIGMYGSNANKCELQEYAHHTMTGGAHPNPMYDRMQNGEYLISAWQKRAKEFGVSKEAFKFGFDSIIQLQSWIGLGDHEQSWPYGEEPGTVPEWLFALGAVVVEYECHDETVVASNWQCVFLAEKAVRVRELYPEEWV